MKKSTPRVKVAEGLRALVSAEDILEAARRLGALQRQRKVDLVALVESTVAAVTPMPGTQTTAFANYIALTGQKLSPSAFFERFNHAFGQLMREVASRAVQAVREAVGEDKPFNELGALLDEFTDVQVADSTCQLLQRLAADWAPSTSEARPAAFKWHALVSLKDELPVADGVTPQRTQDTRALPDEALSPGTLTFMDLGYTDTGRFLDAIEAGAHFLVRLKAQHDPKVLRVHVGKGERVRARGMRLTDALLQGVLKEEGGVIDVDVQLEKHGRTACARVVAVEGPEGERRWYLTTVGRDVLTAHEVAEAYRLRWRVELLFKALKSGVGLSALRATRPGAVLSLVYAKVIALALSRLLELSMQQKAGEPGQVQATGRLALVLALTRCAPLLLSHAMMSRGVTLEQLEERILLIAEVTARSRQQRRERERRKREASLGSGG
ncbi:IS4 family transposase [Corallococcus sp. AB030]|uniref:IS4 family transposase n=1 Tax=unclassified Corallococcus TaxID=2685029 RepID=UPI000EA05BC1|nr:MULTISPECIES: IS4 family transposase [unclassified Corallococcus]RKH11253.1 IS4 family transposase [Corallococcus sp. CA041A]RKH92954.1 IS4 family transposase [Corallococcus sp. AB030]